MYFPGETAREVQLRKTPPKNSKTTLLRYVEQFVSRPGHIVEWGCGGGWNLVAFRDAGWKTLGFDHDTTYLAIGREVLGLDLRQIDEEALRLEKIGRPDVILLNHVLEHVRNPAELLSKLREMSDTMTIIVVGVPLQENIKTSHWKDYFHVAHIHYFSQRTLKFVASQAKLQLLDEDIKRGLFVFKRADNPNATTQNLSSVSFIRSVLFLLNGFLDPGYRMRVLLRRVLGVLGILGLARRLRQSVGR
jgi:hypothetical protein